MRDPAEQKARNPTVDEATYLAIERGEIQATRAERLGVDERTAEHIPWAGIGLSGGGIRSASLSLGVLQALAEKDLLKRFDYISSVSGGGYVAGALQWWWHHGPRDDSKRSSIEFGLGPRDFPYGPARIAVGPETGQSLLQGRRNLAFLRSHSSYLIPGNGLTSWSMVAVLLRTIVISLFTWLLVLTACFVFLHYLNETIEGWVPRMVSPLGPLVPSRWDSLGTVEERAFQYRAIYAIALWLYFGMIGLFCTAAIVFALVSRAPQGSSARWTIPTFTIVLLASVAFLVDVGRRFHTFDDSIIPAVAIAVLIALVSLAIVLAELLTPRSLNASYWLRRSLEIVLGATLVPSLALLAFALVPLVPHWLSGQLQGSKITAAGTFGLLSGIASALYGYYTFIRNIIPSMAAQIAATVGSALYLYATLMIAYFLAIVLEGGVATGDFNYVPPLLQALLLVALVLGFYANINYVGLHRFYRDRLMEAFMPTDEAVCTSTSLSSPLADNLLVSALKADGKLRPVPYPLINTNLILLNDRQHKYAVRGGDNFVISPLFVGSSATLWQDTDAYISQKGPLTLASSVAASGAAATASAGYIGTGITMNPLVAAVMSLLNIRLGLWVPNPGRQRIGPFSLIPTFFYPGLVSGVLSRRHTHQSRFLELTDGGHFENLGLYELVRRKLPVILIVDGEADPSISLASLVSAARRIEQDFKATLTFFKGRGPESLMMEPSKGYPSGVRYAEAPFIVGQIRYDGGQKGVLIYLKSTLIKTIDFTTAGYLATNPAFPHESTVDQFFDPDQFDAYRYLGYEAAKTMIDSLDLPNKLHCLG